MDISKQLFSVGEPYAAGLFEFPERGVFYRYCNALYRYWQSAEIAPYDGGELYPCGAGLSVYNDGKMAVRQSFSFSIESSMKLLSQKCPDAVPAMKEEIGHVPSIDTPHTIGGAGFTHSFINYDRIMREGLCTYRRRVEALSDGDFRDGLLRLLDGIEVFRVRVVDTLVQSGAPEKLIDAMEHANEPPQTLYEALVLWNFVYYVDGCDDIGHLDKALIRLYKGEDMTAVIRRLFRNVDANSGWSGALGPEYNDLTIQCINACHSIRRPNLQLLVRKDMPAEVWQAVYGSLSTSCGQPALYNVEMFESVLERFVPQVTPEDRAWIAFGGCTETMIEGMSNVGSDDAGIHTALVFDRVMRSSLSKHDTFDGFYDELCRTLGDEIRDTLEKVNRYKVARAKYRPQPVRTLFIDDCIDRQLDFNDGGTRYCWGVANVSGMINVIDSLLSIRTLIYEKHEYTQQSFIELLDARDALFMKKARACPCFGVDDDGADALAVDFATKIYDFFNQVPCYPRGKYFPVSNQFTTFEGAGTQVRATPDGRADFEPLCDCLGAVHGKDTKGPTALLNSVSKLPLYRVLGTPVMNLRIKKENIDRFLKPLTLGFFERGGMQLQISCLSREEMLDAMEHPERHENLIVRVGGFSEYFNNLSPVLKQHMLSRTEY